MRVTSAQTAVVLGSWKEIAAYLGKGVRTVQRWEQQFGLPVRRPNGRSEGIVYATREELDRWILSGRVGRPEAPLPSNSNGLGNLTSAQAGVKIARELVAVSRQLREDLRSNVHALASQCRAVTEELGRLHSMARPNSNPSEK